MAISTALRFRNRSQPNPVVVSDTIAKLPGLKERVLLDSLTVSDSEVVIYRRLSPGERIATVVDSDSSFEDNRHVLSDALVIVDSVAVEKNIRKTLSDVAVGITDAGFITDKDLLRYRQLSDSISVTDGFQKTITLADFAINSKVRFDSIVVTDNVDAVSSGVQQRTKSDSVAVNDSVMVSAEKAYSESATATDADVLIRYRNRTVIDTAVVRDDVIVGRGSLTSARVLADSLSTIDRKTASKTSFTTVSAKIKHGIENQ